MLGFFIGVLQCDGGAGVGHAGGVRRWRRRRGQGGSRAQHVVRRVLSRRAATPDQEAEVPDTSEGLFVAMDALRVDARVARADVSAALREDTLDPARLDALAAERRSALERGWLRPATPWRACTRRSMPPSGRRSPISSSEDRGPAQGEFYVSSPARRTKAGL